MLTAEQANAATKALLPDQDKYLAYIQHKEACKAMSRYHIPYRVYLDYLKRPDKILKDNKCYIKINPLYPKPGYKSDEIKAVCADCDFKPQEEQEESTAVDEGRYSLDNLKPEVQREVLRIIEPMKMWGFMDDKWKYYFLHFLKGYDFNTFTEFDFSGTNGEMTAPDLGLLKNIYERLSWEYNQSPDDYMNDEPTISISEYGMYRNEPFILCMTREEVAMRNRIIDRHKRGHEYTDEEYYYIFGTSRSALTASKGKGE